MADTLLLRALKGQAKSVNLSCKKLRKVPKLIGQIETVLHIDLKGNRLEELPDELRHLIQLEILNLGNNEFKEFPACIATLFSLQTLHLFQNRIETIPEGLFGTVPDLTHDYGSKLDQLIQIQIIQILDHLRRLTVLNLNNNCLTKLPKDICKLICLEKLSLDSNNLRVLPLEICALTKLKELRIAKNRLERLPLEFGFLINLEELHVPLNKLRELPESIGKCYKLRIVDVAGNDLRIFPTETSKLPLEELHCEENPLLTHLPVHSIQEEEVLSLKEITARYIMKALKDRFSPLRAQLRSFPDLKPVLSQSSSCAVCGEPFLNTWLECVHFIKPKKMKLKCSSTGPSHDIPIRALLCSYTCFNNKNHEFYGVAFP